MNTRVGDNVGELVKAMAVTIYDVSATSQGAVIVLTHEGVERRAIERYRRVYKARKLGLGL
jgi:hypothetical protein